VTARSAGLTTPAKQYSTGARRRKPAGPSSGSPGIAIISLYPRRTSDDVAPHEEDLVGVQFQLRMPRREK
jgi:hypothetical protein